MAPRTIGGLAGGMAHGGHIRCENYEFAGIGGPAPTSAYSRCRSLRHGDLGLMAHGGYTLRTTPGGSISEFTYIVGPVPSLVTSHGQVLHPRGRRPMAFDKLT